MSNFSVRRTLNWPGVGPPIRNVTRLPSASSPRSEKAIRVPASGWPLRDEDQPLEPLVVRQLAQRGRHLDHLAAGARAAFRKIVAQDLVDALEPDIDDVAVARQRLRIPPEALFRDRPSLRIEQRRGLDVVEPGHPAAGIADGPGEPAALVGDRKETFAFRIQPDAGQAAEAAIGRGQHQAAAIFQRTEARARAVARLEIRDRPRVDLDADGLGDGALDLERPRRRLGRDLRLRRAGQCESGKSRRRVAKEAAAGSKRAHECSLRRGRLAEGCGAVAVSLNSSASFSVMAPPSSSASTIVTARR
ncbi:hypothetical protein ACVJMY_000838 [Bradyrhizobium diazoefficiens]